MIPLSSIDREASWHKLKALLKASGCSMTQLRQTLGESAWQALCQNSCPASPVFLDLVMATAFLFHLQIEEILVPVDPPPVSPAHPAA